MKKCLLYASPLCSDCSAAKELLESNGIKYAYVEITGGMFQLKKFLQLRDTHPAFAAVREAGRVGIPCIVVDDEHVFLDPNAVDYDWIRKG